MDSLALHFSLEHISNLTEITNFIFVRFYQKSNKHLNIISDNTVAYEAVEEDHENLTQEDSQNYMSTVNSNNTNIIIKPEMGKLNHSFHITAVEQEQLSAPPQLQQKPVMTNFCSESASTSEPVDTEEYFSKTIASYLRQLSPRHKIKAKVEMMQIIEKFIELEESNL